LVPRPEQALATLLVQTPLVLVQLERAWNYPQPLCQQLKQAATTSMKEQRWSP
jgi:hypothetical protein